VRPVLLVPPVLWCSGATRAAGAAGAVGAAGAAVAVGFAAFSTSSFVTRGPSVFTDAMSILLSRAALRADGVAGVAGFEGFEPSA